MTKMTAAVANKLTAKCDPKIKSFQDAIDKIVLATKMGACNCFIDGSKDDLMVVSKELKERGFKVYLDIVDSAHYLSVEW